MKSFKSLFIIITLATVAACSKEDTPEPLYHSPAPFFMPAEDATDPTSVLRREFYAKHSSYLLFNDTIQKYNVGTDINGDEVYQWETLDLGYSIGFSYSTSVQYRYTYITDYATQKAMVDYLENYVMYHFTGKAKPFMYMISNTITSSSRSGNVSKPYAAAGQRGVSVACNYLLAKERTEAQKQAYAERIISIMIGQLANNFSESFEGFYKYSASYYNTSWSGSDKTAVLASMGFIGTASSLVSFCPSQSDDLGQYALATIQYSEEEFNEKYGNYPIVITKYMLVKNTLRQLGFSYEKPNS